MDTKRLLKKEKKSRRKEVLEKRKAIDGIIKAASAEADHLALFQPFQKFDRNGLSLYLESGFGDLLSSPMKKYVQCLLKLNMEGPYGSEWPAEEKIKCREMVAPEARYIFVRKARGTATKETPGDDLDEHQIHWMADGDRVVGFVQYRFTVEEDIPVVYVYELQLEPFVQGKGLGKFLMQLIELIARKNQMGAVMLTVQKANSSAMHFYISKLRYTVSVISPSRFDPLIGAGKSYEILCKTFHPEAKDKLEGNSFTGEAHH
ncbi:unnamed protein product [Victoria cruziana]